MFQYEYEKRPPSAASCSSRATMAAEWGRGYPNPHDDSRGYPKADDDRRGYPRAHDDGRGHPRAGQNGTASVCASVERARRPLPPRPISDAMPAKTTVPLKVWIIASASCFAVCAALVLATVVITKWGTAETYTRHEVYSDPIEPAYSYPEPQVKSPNKVSSETEITSDELEDDLQFPIEEKLLIFKNIVANREKNKNPDRNNKKTDASLISKPQIHPIHDTMIVHEERKIEKKDQAKLPLHFDISRHNKEVFNDMMNVPDFKPTLPDVLKMVKNIRKQQVDYEEYYNDENLYDDYMQSNTMTSYLIEKVQELHDWINTDPDFEAHNATKKENSGNEFTQLLKALNESLVEGNVTIIMNKLKDIYFGENFTMSTQSRKVILTNSTDLLSFGILSLDIMLLHNIQLMAWESQEAARVKMMKEPEVFAFNALFMEPSKIEAKQNEIYHYDTSIGKRQNLRQETDEYDFGRSLLENVLDLGMSTARAAIHLGRAYKNTKIILNQLSNKETLNANIQSQISRNGDANTHALQHLQTSFNGSSVNNTSFTELDCMWLLYCRNLVHTAKLSPPYGTMARINGMALRMLTGELSADKALDTMLYEALSGWTELRCNDMFPRCSKDDAARIVLDSLLQPLRKSHTHAANRSR